MKWLNLVLVALPPSLILWGLMAALITWQLGQDDTDLFLMIGTSVVIVVGGTISFWLMAYEVVMKGAGEKK